ncbi:hypothetical protein GALMADRAFT_893520 [Galerina marginata CBS 339.88]|uniref:Uncharacterized protein n=1 Tax=Galerina marginata (strain CBS 339.88) TaxID=685588 RepID=A0A067SRB7_GALM3|nr:hypothetical protein GALMADRAFT_893520 [Galerina marginata CBS 339.88]
MENFETMDVRLPIAQQPASPTGASKLLALESCLSEDSPENARNAVAERKEEGTAVDHVSDPLSSVVSSPSSCEAPSSFVSPVFASSASGDSISIYSCSSAPISPLAGLANSIDSEFEGKNNLRFVSSSPENVDAGNQDHLDARTFDLEDDVSYSDSLNIPLRKLKAVYQRTLRSDRSIEPHAKNFNDLLESKIPPQHNPGSPPYSQASEQALEDVLSVTSDDLDRDFRSFWPYNKSLHTSLRYLPPLGGRGARGRPHKGFQGTPFKGHRGPYLDNSDAPPLPGPGPLTPTPVTPPDLERLSFHDSSVIHSSFEGSEALGLSARERRARGYGQIYDDIYLAVGQWSCNGLPSDCSASFPQKPLVSYRGHRDQPLLQPRHILERKAKSGPRRILRAGPAF